MPQARRERPTRNNLQAQVNALSAIIEVMILTVPEVPRPAELAVAVKALPAYRAETRDLAGFMLLRMAFPGH